MGGWLGEHIGTIAVGAAVACMLAALAVKLIRDKKNGKSGCACGCGGCAMRDTCHASKKTEQ